MAVAYFTRDFAAQHPGGSLADLKVRNGRFEVKDPNSGRIERVPLHRPDIARVIQSGLMPASVSRAPQHQQLTAFSNQQEGVLADVLGQLLSPVAAGWQPWRKPTRRPPEPPRRSAAARAAGAVASRLKAAP